MKLGAVSSDLLLAGAGESAAPAKADRERLERVAAEFEALLLAQMLRSARESGEGDAMTGGGKSSASMTDFAEQHLAQALAAQGGLGLASLVVQGLERDPKSQRESRGWPIRRPDD